ncbi:putative RNA-directed DNA polymerase [Tanacetum coccineum]
MAGCAFDEGEANAFNDFISRAGLFDFPLNGRRFTRFDKYGSKASNPNSLNPDLRLKDKLKIIRSAIRCWTIQRSEEQEKDKEVLLNYLVEWDIKAETGQINQFDIDKREEKLMDLNFLEQLKMEDLKQKCWLKWSVEGDENSRFFHSILKNNLATIKVIHSNGIWLESPGDIKLAAMEHFSSRFKEICYSRPSFNSMMFRKLSALESSSLEMCISMEEVKYAVWDCDGSKAPGPDDFNFNFIKTYWDVLKKDFLDCIKHFEATGSIANGCNPSFIVLIPKKQDPLGFLDYQPISLIGCVNKVISKILASRIAKVMSSIIGPNQTTFIAGRQILDGCLVANEIIRMANIEKHKLLLFKVDFEKAFDSVNWNFFYNTMRQMGFGEKWIKWIFACLSSASISVLVNGSPSREFKMEIRLRQGDPLSPFLFLIIAEDLQISIFNAMNLILILKCFENASGLKINLSKSKIYRVGVQCNEVEEIASSLGCDHGSIPFMYLGLPVGKRMRFCDG